jgi:flagellar basal-body rod protein FlgG
MDPGLTIAATGMIAEQVREDQLTNDLSNASTPGYKPDESSQGNFNTLLLGNMSNGQPLGTLTTDVQIDRTVTNVAPVPLQTTGQPLDFGIAGVGYFAVRTAQGVRYTRDGQFTASANGTLVDQNGDQVLGQGGAPIRVTAAGTVPAASLGVFAVPNAVKQGDNLFAGAAAGRATGVVESGKLEQSGVDAASVMVHMISSLESYDAGQKALQTFDQTEKGSASTVGSVGGGG